jgi:hypothetical protein
MIVATVNWIKAQLTDPTSAMHAMGFGIIGGEVGRHWLTGTPVDVGAVAAGFSCFGVGGAIDAWQSRKVG